MADNATLLEDKWYHNKSDSCFYMGDGSKLPFTFNPDERVFTTSSGVDLLLGVVTSDLVLTFQGHLEVMTPLPTPPETIQEYGKDEFYKTPDYKDVAYIQANARAIRERGLNLLFFMYGVSVDNDLDELEVIVRGISNKYKKATEFMPPKGEGQRAYMLCTSLIQSEMEVTILTGIIQGQVMPTEKAIEVAENRFPDENQ